MFLFTFHIFELTLFESENLFGGIVGNNKLNVLESFLFKPLLFLECFNIVAAQIKHSGFSLEIQNVKTLGDHVSS